MRLHKTITVERPLEKVFGYLSDFTTTTEWDPATVQTMRIAGDGAVGTEYLNTTRFAGRKPQLTYVVRDLVPNQRIALRGENMTVIACDTMTFRPSGSGTEVTYTADFTFQGLTRFPRTVAEARPGATRQPGRGRHAGALARL